MQRRLPTGAPHDDGCSYLARVRPMPLSANLGTERTVSTLSLWPALSWRHSRLCVDEPLPEHGVRCGSCGPPLRIRRGLVPLHSGSDRRRRGWPQALGAWCHIASQRAAGSPASLPAPSPVTPGLCGRRAQGTGGPHHARGQHQLEGGTCKQVSSPLPALTRPSHSNTDNRRLSSQFRRSRADAGLRGAGGTLRPAAPLRFPRGLAVTGQRTGGAEP